MFVAKPQHIESIVKALCPKLRATGTSPCPKIWKSVPYRMMSVYSCAYSSTTPLAPNARSRYGDVKNSAGNKMTDAASMAIYV